MYLEDIVIGQSAESTRAVSRDDIVAFAALSGDRNAVHLDPEFAATTPFKGIVAHGMLSASFISAILGTRLPGEGTIYLAQNLNFLAPVRPGDLVTTVVTVTAAREQSRSRGEVILSTTARVGDLTVLTGEARVMVPRRSRPAEPGAGA